MSSPPYILSRLFVEIDPHPQITIGIISMLACNIHKLPLSGDFFDQVIFNADLKKEEVWDAIKKHDGIYCSTSLELRIGVSGGALFNYFMQKAIAEQVTGKNIFIFREYKDIDWRRLNPELVDQSLRANSLFTSDEKFVNWVRVDIDQLLKEIQKNKSSK